MLSWDLGAGMSIYIGPRPCGPTAYLCVGVPRVRAWGGLRQRPIQLNRWSPLKSHAIIC